VKCFYDERCHFKASEISTLGRHMNEKYFIFLFLLYQYDPIKFFAHIFHDPCNHHTQLPSFVCLEKNESFFPTRNECVICDDIKKTELREMKLYFIPQYDIILYHRHHDDLYHIFLM